MYQLKIHLKFHLKNEIPFYLNIQKKCPIKKALQDTNNNYLLMMSETVPYTFKPQ